jgi:hypothetical protein
VFSAVSQTLRFSETLLANCPHKSGVKKDPDLVKMPA